MRFLAYACFVIFFSLLPNSAHASEKTGTASWSEKMQGLSKTLSDIMPDLVSTRPPDAKTAKRLNEGAATLSRLSHQVNKGVATAPDADPSVAMLSTLFDREAKAATRAFKSGNAEYGKASLRLLAGYCISCHTRTDTGPKFPSLALNPRTASLSKMELAQLLEATRQFDAALDAFESVVSDPSTAAKKQIEWGRAVRQAFTIAIRVQKDPERALKIIKRVEALPSVPALFKDYVAIWKKSLVEWKTEAKKTLATEEALFEEANRLSKLAQSSQKYPMDHSADVLYLRASLAAHELLSQHPQGKRVSETLLLLGSSYDLLDDSLLSPLPEMYFETCIRRSPHSTVAQTCYERYEANVYFGYTGSGGTSIPEDIESVMKELKDLAKPKKS